MYMINKNENICADYLLRDSKIAVPACVSLTKRKNKHDIAGWADMLWLNNYLYVKKPQKQMICKRFQQKIHIASTCIHTFFVHLISPIIAHPDFNFFLKVRGRSPITLYGHLIIWIRIQCSKRSRQSGTVHCNIPDCHRKHVYKMQHLFMHLSDTFPILITNWVKISNI